MTKNEILEINLSKTFPDSFEKGALNAMDEWGKQQAIAYCEWYNSIGILPKVYKSHTELYDEFIKQQTNHD